MVIKTKSHKQKSFREIIEYVNTQKRGTLKKDSLNDLKIYYNLQSVETEEMIQEFESNFKYKPERSNGVKFYHEMMSFSALDSDHLSIDVLEDLAYKYLENRTPKGIAYCACHTDKEHIHLHFVISSNKIFSQQANRLSIKEFHQVRKTIENYQKEKFPELKHSIVYDGFDKKLELWDSKEKGIKLDSKKEDSNTRRETLYRVKSRGGSDKSQMTELFVETITKSKSPKEFHQTICDKDVRGLYIYRNKVTGIIYNGRKYRFSTLLKGIEDSKEKDLCKQKLEQFRRLGLLQQVRERTQQLEKDNGKGLTL